MITVQRTHEERRRVPRSIPRGRRMEERLKGSRARLGGLSETDAGGRDRHRRKRDDRSATASARTCITTALPNDRYTVQYTYFDEWVGLIDEFYDNIREKKTPLINLRWHKKTIEAMNAVYESISTGKSVKLLNKKSLRKMRRDFFMSPYQRLIPKCHRSLRRSYR